MINIGQYRGRKPVTRLLNTSAANDSLGSLANGVGDLPFEHVDLWRTRNRADVGRLSCRVADLEAFDFSDKCLHEVFVDRLVNINALDGTAALPCVVHRAVGERRRSVWHVDIVADIDGILATELELQLHHAWPKLACDALPRGIRASEEDAVDRLLDQLGSDTTVTDYHCEYRFWNTGPVQQLSDFDAR